MKKKLKDFKVAILVCDGFEEVEMTKPRQALRKEDARVYLISTSSSLKSWQHAKWSKKYKTNILLRNAKASQFDALMLPGGVMNPDALRTNKKALEFIDYFFKNNKPIAAICHAPSSLIETNRLKGRKLTSYRSIKTDLLNAGADWVNKKVVVDHNLVTSREPKDLPSFNRAMIKVFQEENFIKHDAELNKERLKTSRQPFIK